MKNVFTFTFRNEQTTTHQLLKRGKIMKKPTIGKGRRKEMYVELGTKTQVRRAKYIADRDNEEILKLIGGNPPMGKSTLSKLFAALEMDPKKKMPLSVAQAIQKYYIEKEKAQLALAQ